MSQVIEGLPKKLLYSIGLGKVCKKTFCQSAKLFHIAYSFISTFLVGTIANDNVCPFLGKGNSNSSSNTSIGTCYNGFFSQQFHHLSPFYSHSGFSTVFSEIASPVLSTCLGSKRSTYASLSA